MAAVKIFLRFQEKTCGQKRRKPDDAIGDAGEGHGTLHETLPLKPGRSCSCAGKTRKKE